MAKRPDSHSEMAQARQSDGLNVIFDQKSPSSARSRSRSTSSSASTRSSSSRSTGPGRYRSRGGRRERHRSSSSSSSYSSSSSSSSSRSRSRSHPRCYRRSSRCGCGDHRRYERDHRRRSPPRRYRAHSRSYSRSVSRDRYTRRSRYYRSRSRSRSRSSGRWSRYGGPGQSRFRFSRSPSRAYRGQSRSRSPAHSVTLTLHDKRELLEAAKANAMKILGVEKLELPESVKPILSEQTESRRFSPEPRSRVRHGSERTTSQDTEEEPGVSSPKMSPRGKIAFSINNSVAKPTVAAPSSAKVTPRVDSYESRKPYGHWIPIGSRQTSSSRKHT